MKKYLIVIEKQSGARESHFDTDVKTEAEEVYGRAVARMTGKRGSHEAVALVETLQVTFARARQERPDTDLSWLPNGGRDIDRKLERVRTGQRCTCGVGEDAERTRHTTGCFYRKED